MVKNTSENCEAFIEKYNLKLSKSQREAVQSTDGPVLLLAVPGSGKTTVLISRLGYMIYGLGIPAESILTMTYTVAATRDMKKRFRTYFGDEYADRVEFRTINGVCEKILMYYSRVENKKIFDVSEDNSSSKLLMEILIEQLQDRPTENDLRDIRTKIAYAKNMLLDEAKIAGMDGGDIPFSKIYKEYNTRMRTEKLMDYDDQLIYAYRILLKYPDILDYYRKKYRYICVDEAQDTSKIQHAIISLLSGKTGNLFMVGDEDQSIYGFRAAYPEALMSFKDDHPGAKIMFMEDNYRSDKNIVDAAGRFIKKNIYRYDKNINAARPAVSMPERINVLSRQEQYKIMLETAQKADSQVAFLYRDNDTSIPLCDILDRKGIPFNIRSGEYSFFGNKIVVDIKNIITFAFNPFNTEIFSRIYSRLALYLTRAEMTQACTVSAEKKIPVLDAAITLELKESVKNNCIKLKSEFDKIPKDTARNAILRIAENMGYSAYIKKNNNDKGKLQILYMLSEYEKTPESFIKRLDYLSNLIKNRTYNPEINIILSTIHSSKGLEYKTVYLADVIDGIFPVTVPQKSLLDNAKAELAANNGKAPEKINEVIKEYEEERRLFYVGVTRAINKLYVFNIAGCESVFSKELFEKEKNPDHKKKHRNNPNPAIIQKKNFEEYCKAFQPSVRIIHETFGPGIVRSAERGFATVRFTNGTEKTFLLEITYKKKLIEFVKT